MTSLPPSSNDVQASVKDVVGILQKRMLNSPLCTPPTPKNVHVKMSTQFVDSNGIQTGLIRSQHSKPRSVSSISPTVFGHNTDATLPSRAALLKKDSVGPRSAAHVNKDKGIEFDEKARIKLKSHETLHTRDAEKESSTAIDGPQNTAHATTVNVERPFKCSPPPSLDQFL